MTLAVRPKSLSLSLSYYNVWVCGGYALGMRRETVAKKLHGYALGRMRPVREARGLPEHEIKEFGYALGMLRSRFGLLIVFTGC